MATTVPCQVMLCRCNWAEWQIVGLQQHRYGCMYVLVCMTAAGNLATSEQTLTTGKRQTAVTGPSDAGALKSTNNTHKRAHRHRAPRKWRGNATAHHSQSTAWRCKRTTYWEPSMHSRIEFEVNISDTFVCRSNATKLRETRNETKPANKKPINSDARYT